MLMKTLCAGALALAGAGMLLSGCGDDDAGDRAGGQAGERTLDFASDMSPVRLGAGVAPVPFRASDERVHLNYELYLTNRRPEPLTVTRVAVVDADEPATVIHELNGAALADHMTRDALGGEASTAMGPSQSAVLYVDASVAAMDDVPEALMHVVESRGPDGEALVAVEGGLVEPRRDVEVPALAKPVSGDTWVAAEGCCAASHHRRALITLAGRDFLSQRYAIDWLKLENGRLYEGDDPKDLQAWHTFGQDALAAADGTVTSVLNDEDDITPFEPNPTPRTVDNITGNHVIIDIGGGLHVVYAHLQRGSVAVEVGDEVATGDTIGLVGNSGNTDAPHLHIHVMDANHVVQSDAIPFVHDRFELIGRFDSILDLLPELDGGRGAEPMLDHPHAGDVTDAYPLELDVVRFPGR